MYLSKISITPSAHSAAEMARLSKNGAYASHQLLWNLFTEDEKRKFLYREEQVTGSWRPLFYVLSQSKPDLNVPLFDIQTKLFAPKLSKGQRLAFKLRANPTVCLTEESGKSKRHDVLMHAKYQAKKFGKAAPEMSVLMDQAALNWISDEKRLSAWGVTLDALPDIERYTQHSSQKKDGHTIRFSSVDFQGMLTVADPQMFCNQYALGFGRAKAMGCGLMLIRPI
jgi:CRISPR system Cascade subunit CasE